MEAKKIILGIILAFFSPAIVFAIPTTSEPIDFSAYQETFEAPEIEKISEQIIAVTSDAGLFSLSASDLALTAIGSRSKFARRISQLATIAEGIDAAKSIYDVSTQDDLQGIQSVFSYTNAADALENAQKIAGQLDSLYTSLKDYARSEGKSFQPTADVYLGAVLDKRTRDALKDYQPKIDSLLSGAQDTKSALNDLLPVIEDARLQAEATRRSFEEVREEMHQFILDSDCASRPCDPVTSEAVIIVGTVIPKLDSDISLVDQAVAAYDSVSSNANSLNNIFTGIVPDLESAKSTVEAALDAPPAKSTYTFSGSFNGGGRIYPGDGYSYSFLPASLSEEGAFIGDDFFMGYLFAYNGYSSKYYYEDYFDITLERETTLLGETYKSSTTATNILRYTVNEVIGGTVAENADWFVFPEINQAAYINEYKTAMFSIFGSINSPLRVSRIEFEPSYDPTAGFVASVKVSEPGSLGIAMFGLLGLLVARSRCLVGEWFRVAVIPAMRFVQARQSIAFSPY